MHVLILNTSFVLSNELSQQVIYVEMISRYMYMGYSNTVNKC